MNQVFRDANGEAVEPTALRLSLRDFVCERCDKCKAVRALECSRDETIVISAEDLCQWYGVSMQTFVLREADAQSSRPRPESTQAAQESVSLVQALTPPAENPQPAQTPPRRSERLRKLRDRLRRNSNATDGPGHNSP